MTLSIADFKARVGQELGVSDWILVDQDRINRFADVTEDHQFIHIDEERAKATPFGGTIAHGLLTLSLLPQFGQQAVPRLPDAKFTINYGFNRVRFMSPVRSGKRVRGRFALQSIDDSQPGRIIAVYDVTVEIEGEDKPALKAEWVGLLII